MTAIHRIEVPTAKAVEGELPNASLRPATMPAIRMTMTRIATPDGIKYSRDVGDQSEAHAS